MRKIKSKDVSKCVIRDTELECYSCHELYANETYCLCKKYVSLWEHNGNKFVIFFWPYTRTYQILGVNKYAFVNDERFDKLFPKLDATQYTPRQIAFRILRSLELI